MRVWGEASPLHPPVDETLPDNLQQRSAVLWESEKLNLKASKFVRENLNVKGRPNMTALTVFLSVCEEFLSEFLQQFFTLTMIVV